MKISIVDDFSRTPGFRFYSDGPFSGEEFRRKHLEPLFEDENNSEKIEVNLDGVAGYATSFLEEAFGGLARKFGIERVLKRIVIVSEDEPLLTEEIDSYIRKSNEKK